MVKSTERVLERSILGQFKFTTEDTHRDG